MKKFGRKGGKGDEDASKAALFGGASHKSQSANPYATAGKSANPYANMGAAGNDPYAPQASAPPAYDGRSMSSFQRDKSPVPPGGYGGGLPPRPSRDNSNGSQGPPGGGYGERPPASRFGSSGIDGGGSRYGGEGPSYGEQSGYGSRRYGDEQQGGYGGSRYGSSGIQEGMQSRRPGGYGGMGMTSEETEQAQGALFGDAPKRYQAQPAPPTNGGEEGASGGYGSRPGGYGSSSGGYGDTSGDNQGYGAYGDRQLTAEEQEEEDINATKQEIRFIKQQDVSSTRNALRLADQAYETGASTLERLGAQGERIHNTERNLDLASVQNRVASEKARELKTLNRSMFAVHVANPFTSQRRREERENKIMETHRSERDARDASRAEAYGSQARQDQFARNLRGQPQRQMNKASLAERSKYQFEADSEDEDMENEIDNNLDMLHGATGKLKNLALAMGTEVDSQNKHIDRITGKVDRVDDEIALNRARLDRIK